MSIKKTVIIDIHCDGCSKILKGITFPVVDPKNLMRCFYEQARHKAMKCYGWTTRFQKKDLKTIDLCFVCKNNKNILEKLDIYI